MCYILKYIFITNQTSTYLDIQKIIPLNSWMYLVYEHQSSTCLYNYLSWYSKIYIQAPRCIVYLNITVLPIYGVTCLGIQKASTKTVRYISN